MTRDLYPHQCPHCTCDWDLDDTPGTINIDAPFYPLVALIEATKAHPIEEQT